MGLFNWFSWCWPNAALRAECFNLRRELGATELLLHEAQRGAELMVQTNEFLNAELKKWRDKCKKLEQPKTATGVTVETSETELEQRAWEIFVHTTQGHTACFTQAKIWMSERDRRRKEQENQTNEQ